MASDGFERRAPVHLEQDEPSGGMSPAELDLTLVRDARSVYLLPIVFSEEVVGVLTLGEVRSREREPFTEEKCRRCLSMLTTSSCRRPRRRTSAGFVDRCE
jgi:hypothetical protein